MLSSSIFNSPHVSTEAISQYRADGVICLRNVIDDRYIDLARQSIEQNCQQRGQFFRDHSETENANRYVFEYWTWPHTPPLSDLIFNSPLAEVAGTLMQTEHVHMVMDNWFMREAGSCSGAPWHHDEPYFDFEGSLCIVWFPLEAAPVEDGLTFVRGSHRWNQLFVAPEFSKNVPFRCEGERYSPVPDIDGHLSDYDLLSWDVGVGDCLVFDFRTLHSVANKGAPAKQTQRRLTLRFGADDVIFSPRGEWTKETSDFLMSLGQKRDAAIDCSLMPLAWKRQHG